MERLIILFLTGIIFYSCGSGPSSEAEMEMANEKMQQVDTVRIANDSLDYELVFVEQGFNYWMETEALPEEEYSQEFLEEENFKMIDTYNFRCVDEMLYPDLYDEQIVYDPQIDYGFKFNYLLYNYLQFFQERYRQNL